MFNNNLFMLTGRTTREIRVYDNKDGSRKVLMTLAVRDNFKSRDGKRHTEFVNVEAYIYASRGGDLGVYGYIHKGDLITVSGSIRSNTYTGKDGKTVFNQVLNIEDVSLLEPKSVTNGRAAAADSDVDMPEIPVMAGGAPNGPVYEGAPVYEDVYEDVSEDDPFGD